MPFIWGLVYSHDRLSIRSYEGESTNKTDTENTKPSYPRKHSAVDSYVLFTSDDRAAAAGEAPATDEGDASLAAFTATESA